MKKSKIVIIGSGVSGLNAVTTLIKGGYNSKDILLLDSGKDPYLRPPGEVMRGYGGSGLFSDGKYSYLHNAVGGHLAKYVGEKEADRLIKGAWGIIKEFHPDPSKIMYSAPIEEPDFIKPYFNLRMAPTYHIGTDYLLDMGKAWFNWLVKEGVTFMWDTTVSDISFDNNEVILENNEKIIYERLIYCTGKSGIDLTQHIIDKHNLPKEPKSVQLGCRFEAPQHHFQKILDVAYDFKLYQRPNDIVSSRSFCTNSNCAYVAEETTYGMKSYNGHSFKNREATGMVNFGIIMEIKGINNPFDFQKEVVEKCQINGKGIHFSPHFTRKPTSTAEGTEMNLELVDNLDIMRNAYGEYTNYIESYINDLNKVFNFDNDYSLYIPEVKFLSEEVLVNYNDLSLINYPNVHMAGDSLSARGIAVSAAQGVLVGESIIQNLK